MKVRFDKAQMLGNSLGNALKTALSGDYYKRKGRQAEQDRLGDLAVKQAQARKYDAEAQKINHRMAMHETGKQDFMMGQTGLNAPQVQRLGDYMLSGSWGSEELEGPPAPGEVSMPSRELPAPDFYTPQVARDYRTAMSVMGANQMGTGDSNAAQLGDLMMDLVKRGHVERMIAGQQPSDRTAAAYGAVEGKPLYSQGASGVLHDYTGDITPTDVSRSTIGKNDAAAEASLAKALLDSEKALNEAAGDGGSTYKASDDNAIRSAVAFLYGSFYDPVTGDMSIRDNKTLKSAVALADAASRIFLEKAGRITHSQAVAQAAAEFGIQLPTAINSAVDAAFSSTEKNDRPTNAHKGKDYSGLWR